MTTELQAAAAEIEQNTRAEPAAPSSDVEADIGTIECIGRCLGGAFERDLLAHAKRIRAHIAELEADNKRLREAHLAIIEHDWRAGDVNNKVAPQPARLLGKCALISQTALAQADREASR